MSMSVPVTVPSTSAALTESPGANPRLQSPYVYLQAAGSDGSDSTSPGIHLRWTFQHLLSAQHLPKGDLSGPSGPFPSELFFNRAKDFVHIYRAPYSDKFFSLTLDLARPTVFETGGERYWRFTRLQPISEDPTIETTLELRFTDVLLYDMVRATVNPVTDTDEFLRRYEGRIEVSAVGKHLMHICIFFEPFKVDPDYKGPLARGEAIATRDRRITSDLYVACRREIKSEDQDTRLCFTCEDMKHIRFRYRNCFPFRIVFQTYEDYILGVYLRASLSWKLLGKFSLTLDDGEVKVRFNNSPLEDVDGRWPKFNEANSATGAFTVQMKNYLDRWSDPAGLSFAVKRYLELSRFDPQALELLMDTSTQPNEASIEVSYLDTLNVVAQDFHVARMLGLGHIDSDSESATTAVVYLLEYVTEAALELFAPASLVTHYYLTPPITRKDYRLPRAPVLRQPRYGLYHQPIENEPPHLLTDPNGYTRFEPSRWINLDRDPYEFEGSLPPFWSGDPAYCLCDSTIPAFYGVEYRKLGELAWRSPEISHDNIYSDSAGIQETVGVPELAENPVFTHRETEEGIHEYALYSINWFARVSPLSNVVATDDTRFPVLRSLKPPANFAVQLIQAENPLIFTTATEQAMLAALSGPDKTLVRVTFDWDQVHNISYQFANEVEFFFRDELPQVVRGIVSTAAGSLTTLSGHRVRVRTAPQTITSPLEVRQPFIPPTQESRWVGGNFVCGGRAYVIDDVEFPDPTGNNPTFIVKQVRQTSTVAGLEPGELITQETWIGPSVPGEAFSVVENVGRPENWDSRLARTVYIEPFHECWTITVSGSAFNDRTYTLRETVFVGGQTRLTVREEINSDSAPFGDVLYRRRARIAQATPGASEFRVEGDLQAGPGGLANGMTVRVFGSPENARTYTVNSVSVAGGQTLIGVNPPPGLNIPSGYLDYQKRLPIASVNRANRQFFLAGNFADELAPPRFESHPELDGTVTERVIGGLTGNATITEFPDRDAGGTPILGSHTGVFEIVFDALVLRSHVDPSIDWYRGTVRVMEDAALFPTSGSPTYREPERKVLNIWETDRSGTTLRLVVFDPTFNPSSTFNPRTDYMPIQTGSGVEVNVHPGYRLSLRADTSGGNNFQESVILPAAGAGSKKTAMAARSADTSLANTVSPLTPPVVLLAQEIRDPVPPGIPGGPIFATRPDFYGKATYTFDVAVNNPYALVFYRGSDRGILSALYKPSTVSTILADLAALQSPDADFTTNRWSDLAQGVTDSTNQFPEYVPGGYRFPVPDNDKYVLPHPDPAVKVRPFASGTLPGLIVDAVRTAIEGSFVPLTEQPLIYSYLTAGTVTSGRPPTVRDSGGTILLPGDAGYDPWPMAVRLPSSGVRFTDYALDGASASRYFYFGIELSNRMQRSDRGPIAGPVTLVNSSPPVAPAIRDVVVRSANPVLGLPTRVIFTLNEYLPTESVTRLQLYRTTDELSARTVRGMELVKTVEVGKELVDDFPGLEFPPFGETLCYRVVALRRFLNEDGAEEFAPSWPSEIRRLRLIDDVVPPAPVPSFSFGVPPPGPPDELPGVSLSWNRTAWNPRYHVFKMNPLGNWVKVHTLESNSATVTLDLATTDLGTNVLTKRTATGKVLYHRFKVVAENSSGLLSKEEKPLVI